MTEADIRQIIQEELSKFMGVSGYLFDRNIKIFDARNIHLGISNGTKLGTAATQKLGLYGTAPVAQQGAINAPSGGTTVDTQARATITTIIADLKLIGITA